MWADKHTEEYILHKCKMSLYWFQHVDVCGLTCGFVCRFCNHVIMSPGCDVRLMFHLSNFFFSQ